MSPYGKEAGSYAAAVGPDPYLVKRGYIDIVVDVRGTGASGGTFDLFDPAQVADGVTLVTWAAGLPHANGKVGLHGASYLGINQLLTAGAVGPMSPLKAIFPIVSATDPYRDTAFMRGIPDGSFDLAYLLITNNVATAVPCFDDDRPAQVGPTALTYTTAPMATAKTIAGPISTTVHASANTTDTEWVVNVEDVAPDGTSKPLTEGALLGSMRAVDASRTWKVGGKVVMPYHDYTAGSALPVTPGQVTQYQIEVFPTYSTIAVGHRLRVTLSTTDAPHLVPTLPQQQKLFGGVYEVQRTALAPSSVTVLLVNR